MEISGLEPKWKICKINILPIKLYPLNLFTLILKVNNPLKYATYLSMYPRNDLNVYGIKPAKLKIALSTNSSTRTVYTRYNYLGYILRPEWFEHSSKLLWTVGFTNYAMAFYTVILTTIVNFKYLKDTAVYVMVIKPGII